MRVDLLVFIALFCGCSSPDREASPSAAATREMDWALNNMVQVDTTTTTTSAIVSSVSENGTAHLVSLSPVAPLIVDLSTRPIGLIRNTFHMYISREILADSSRTSLTKFNLFGIPRLIDAYRADPLIKEDIGKIILLVAGELVASEESNDIVSAVAPVCQEYIAVERLETSSRVVDALILNRFKYVLEMYPHANLGLVCRQEVESDLELAYAVLLHKAYREAILGPQPEAGAAIWTQSRLENSTSTELLILGLGFMSKSSPERLKLGIRFPERFSKREWFDRFTPIILSKKIESRSDFFPNLGIEFSKSKFRAIGKFMALSVLEMEPLGSEFSESILKSLVGEIEPSDDFIRALCEGFHSLIPLSSLQFLNPVSLGAIIRGRNLAILDDIVFESKVELRRSEALDQALFDWAMDASKPRGIAIGSFGPPFNVFVNIVDADSSDPIISPGGVVTISRKTLAQVSSPYVV